MGFNINVLKAPCFVEDHPEWDWFRYAGDGELKLLKETLPYVERGECWRPENFAEWRSLIEKVYGERRRFSTLLDLLENNPDYWIRIDH